MHICLFIALVCDSNIYCPLPTPALLPLVFLAGGGTEEELLEEKLLLLLLLPPPLPPPPPLA